jgi:hypothetical protein
VRRVLRPVRRILSPISERATDYWKGFDPREIGPSQSNEADLIDSLLAGVRVRHTFCEFGFHVSEFNCGRLALRGWTGLLVDGSELHVRTARRIFARGHLKVSTVQAFLDLDNLRSTIMGRFTEAPGVLSVDVDGNDYWFLEALLPWGPQLVIAEYNASLGLRPLTVPYDPAFERHKKHPSGWYHGASITAFHGLFARHGYSLLAVSDSGINLFFMQNALMSAGHVALAPANAYRECTLRNDWSKTTAAQQWETIRDLPFLIVAFDSVRPGYQT